MGNNIVEGRTDALTFRRSGSQIQIWSFRVYSDRTRQRQNDGLKPNALDLEHMLVNRSIQTGCVASKNLYNKDAVVWTLVRPV